MALESIAAVEAAESAAARLKAEAALRAKELVARAEKNGREAVETARKTAAEKLLQVEKDADDRITEGEKRILREAEDEMDMLRARAEGRLDAAADKIMERIVNGK